MTVIEVTMIIITVLFMVLVMTIIPTFLAIRRSAISACSLTDMLSTELKPAIQELTSVLKDLNTNSIPFTDNPLAWWKQVICINLY